MREVVATALLQAPGPMLGSPIYETDGAACADLVLRALREAGYHVAREGEHLLHQEVAGWAMEHTLSCRERGLARCALHALAAQGRWSDLEPGLYRLAWDRGDVRAEVWP